MMDRKQVIEGSRPSMYMNTGREGQQHKALSHVVLIQGGK